MLKSAISKAYEEVQVVANLRRAVPVEATNLLRQQFENELRILNETEYPLWRREDNSQQMARQLQDLDKLKHLLNQNITSNFINVIPDHEVRIRAPSLDPSRAPENIQALYNFARMAIKQNIQIRKRPEPDPVVEPVISGHDFPKRNKSALGRKSSTPIHQGNTSTSRRLSAKSTAHTSNLRSTDSADADSIHKRRGKRKSTSLLFTPRRSGLSAKRSNSKIPKPSSALKLREGDERVHTPSPFKSSSKVANSPKVTLTHLKHT